MYSEGLLEVYSEGHLEVYSEGLLEEATLKLMTRNGGQSIQVEGGANVEPLGRGKSK